ncbi:ATP-binding protein [Meridianimarinicoccus roseus]|jgi:hypothetical protein|nr:ATP-binding protein [Meridianimarinicoccus roseus]
MKDQASISTAPNLDAGLDFLARLVSARVAETEGRDPGELPLPQLFDDGTPLAALCQQHGVGFDTFTVLMLALAPHLRPQLLSDAFAAAIARPGDFPQMGGRRHAESRAMLPTGETAAFLLAGDDIAARADLHRLFEPDHWLAAEDLVSLEEPAPGAPRLSGTLELSGSAFDRLVLGRSAAPRFSARFPARRVTTRLGWEDLVLADPTRAGLDALDRWLRHRAALDGAAAAGRHLRPGFRALFHGPPGTGKTLSAGLLGQKAGLEVYRVDLSLVVSKYIGETEKNLGTLFATARARDWVLFFDEADALFGKRTAVTDAHDRYANQEVSYLLSRVEDYDGLVILCSNLRSNIDDAFLGRFDAIVAFTPPGVSERAAIWAGALPDVPAPADPAAFSAAMARFELSGRAIVGAVRHATARALDASRATLTYTDAAAGVAHELEKEGRIFRNLVEPEIAAETAD